MVFRDFRNLSGYAFSIGGGDACLLDSAYFEYFKIRAWRIYVVFGCLTALISQKGILFVRPNPRIIFED